MDRYAYVNNNPVNYNDPSGHVINPPFCLPGFCDSTWLSFSEQHPLIQTIIEVIAAPICFYFLGCNVDMVNRNIDGPTTRQYTEAQQYSIIVGADINFTGVASELNIIRQLLGNEKGSAFEQWLKKAYGGEGSFKFGGSQFDNKVGNVLMEAKARNWEIFTPTSEAFSKFQNQVAKSLLSQQKEIINLRFI